MHSLETVHKNSADKKLVKEATQNREIVQEILKFGITQQQILGISYLLSLELEDRAVMIKVSSALKEHMYSLEEPRKHLDIIT